jgi:hypothetical protein
VTRFSAPVAGGPNAIKQAARAILARPEFQLTPPSPVERLRAWIGRELSSLIENALGFGPHGILGALIALVLLGGLVFIIVRAVRATGSNPVRDGFVVGGRCRPPEDWLAEAARREAEGDWRGALRCRYRGLIAELARRGLIEEIPGTTTGEYRRVVSANLPTGSKDFGGVTELFELAWYGDEPTDAETAASFRSLSERVLEAAR